jgi:hypothetical protein
MAAAVMTVMPEETDRSKGEKTFALVILSGALRKILVQIEKKFAQFSYKLRRAIPLGLRLPLEYRGY